MIGNGTGISLTMYHEGDRTSHIRESDQLIGWLPIKNMARHQAGHVRDRMTRGQASEHVRVR